MPYSIEHCGFKYSEKYYDEEYEYRHVEVPDDKTSKIKDFANQNKLLSEDQWRGLGIQQSLGWCHYMWYRPNPSIMLFRRVIQST